MSEPDQAPPAEVTASGEGGEEIRCATRSCSRAAAPHTPWNFPLPAVFGVESAPRPRKRKIRIVLREGKGGHTFPDGTAYFGDWKENKRDGVGTMKYARRGCGARRPPPPCLTRLASGTVYEGGWKEDLKQGHGVVQFANGDV